MTQLFQVAVEQAPEKILARIAGKAADFLAVLNQYEGRREDDALDMDKIIRPRIVDVDAAQRRAFRLGRVWIGRYRFRTTPVPPPPRP